MHRVRYNLAIFCFAIGWLTWGVCPARGGADAPLPERVEFNRDIRPILSDNCFQCHGFDKNTRDADLRLDIREGALAAGDGGDGPAVVPGKPGESQLIARVKATGRKAMPPAKSKKPPLTARQVALLEKWIEQGAEYQGHWAYQAVRKPAVPAPAAAAPQSPAFDAVKWTKSPIDAFVVERLRREGLSPLAEADKVTLIRRVTLDLTGLPPTPAEVDAFLADQSPDAYEKVVDRLLSSVRYGERMALEWLDAARYADTHGYHIDSGRDMTRWREWVIDAFHKNKRYDQFTIEQLAGDLLPNATLDQKIASGFNRNHMVNFEGGAIAEEYRTAYIIDRVNTTGTVWLGLTVACTQCHDHKYDPISQKEYFQLYAFFNSNAEKGLDGNYGNAVPYIPAPTAEQSAKLAALTEQVKAVEAKLTGPSAEADGAQAEWEATVASGGGSQPAWRGAEALTLSSAGGATMAQHADQSITATGKKPARETYTVSLRVPAAMKSITGVRLEVLPDKVLPAGGPGRSENGNLVMTGFSVATSGGEKGEPFRVKLKSAVASFSQDGFPIANLVKSDAGKGWAIYPEVNKPQEAVFAFETPVTLAGETAMLVTLSFQSQFAGHQPGRFRLSLTGEPTPRLAGAATGLPAQVSAALAVAKEKRTDAQKSSLNDYFRRNVWAGGRAIANEIAEAKKARDAFEKTIPTAMIMQELPTPRDTYVLMRGEYDKPDKTEKLTPGVPAFLPPLPKDQPANRLAFAKWLVDPQHPLTSRVTVNRYWQMIFGTGLVKTVEDFGSQGDAPSHADLLDWLAADFMEHGWDTRRLIRQFVTSATYRQASTMTAATFGKDPENRLLARGTRHRLQAEMIRDQALAASGLLDARVGGYSVSPYQPAGLWEELMSRSDNDKWSAQKYVQSKGDDLYRRTMYTFWKRTCPPPTLATFDAPDRETCIIRRSRTNTPLQALVLMNDPTYVEAARKLAERAINETPTAKGDAGGKDGAPKATDEEKIAYAFRQVLARSPRAEEVKVLREMLDKQRLKFAGDKASAEKLLKVGESPADATIAADELAAWATVCSVILNLDEAVTRG